ncbi:MAG: hypothetical protein LBG92_02485 [Prevotellaceae bacterium]|jgi:hypothetical protein|nr:hypothetical protein [Prevotellaceae bacterium]
MIRINNYIVFNIAMLGFTFCFVSCIITDDSLCGTDYDRVLIVYFGGDNNLSGETLDKVEALKKGLTPDYARCKLLVYRDPSDNAPSLTEITNRNGKTVAETVAVYEEENSASAVVFARVVSEIKKKYHGKTYSLLLFSHGSGWLPQGALTNPRLQRSIVMDGRNEMEIADFARAIPDKTFDCIVFEACLMACVEVAYELRAKTDYILASSAEIVSPGFTEIYPVALGDLLNVNLTAFADKAFNYFDSQSGIMKSATFSIIKTAALQPLADFVAENCHLDATVDARLVQSFDRNASYRLFFDFEDYYSRLLDSDSQRQELQRLINDCVIWKKATASFLDINIARHSGLTSYIVQQNFPALNAFYENMEWRKAVKM